MNEGIELHDSKLAGVSLSGGEVVVFLSPAYVHRSSGRPGTDSGSVWLQDASIAVGSAAPCPWPASLPATVSDGSLRIGSLLHDNVIPVASGIDGAIELSLVLTCGESLNLRGQHVDIRLLGEASYLEDFSQ
jgi:hypothetical protein